MGEDVLEGGGDNFGGVATESFCDATLAALATLATLATDCRGDCVGDCLGDAPPSSPTDCLGVAVGELFVEPFGDADADPCGDDVSSMTDTLGLCSGELSLFSGVT